MKQQQPVPEEKGERAPIWIISFADMISLMMAFFVMLVTMANTQSGQLGNESGGGIDVFEETLHGFRNTVAGFGLPGLFGEANEKLYFDSKKAYFGISTGDDIGDNGVIRIIDAREERIRRIFNSLEKQTRTSMSQIRGRQPDFVVTPITFKQDHVILDKPAQQFLNKFAADFQQPSLAKGLTLYIVGLAAEQSGEKEQWIVSAKRADAVADYLRSILKSDRAIYSWGAGAGGDWAGRTGTAFGQAQILIGVLKSND